MQMQFYRALMLAALLGVCAAHTAVAQSAAQPAATPAPPQSAEPASTPGLPPGALTTTACNNPGNNGVAAPATPPPAGMTFVRRVGGVRRRG